MLHIIVVALNKGIKLDVEGVEAFSLAIFITARKFTS
jgi:hypothetical protein